MKLQMILSKGLLIEKLIIKTFSSLESRGQQGKHNPAHFHPRFYPHNFELLPHSP